MVSSFVPTTMLPLKIAAEIRMITSDFPWQKSKKARLARGEVWCVRVLEFVLERRRFYSPIVNASLIVKNRVFHS
jgi:hypothetical protein